MSDIAILDAFVLELESYASGQSPEIPLIQANVGAVTPSTGLWLEWDYFPDTPNRLSWGNGECKEFTGYFQIGVGYRFDDGVRHAMLQAEALQTVYPEGFEAGPVAVFQTAIERKVQNIDDSTQNIIPVRAYYRGLSK